VSQRKCQRKEKEKIFRKDKGEGKDCVLAYGTYGTWAYEYLFLPLSLSLDKGEDAE